MKIPKYTSMNTNVPSYIIPYMDCKILTQVKPHDGSETALWRVVSKCGAALNNKYDKIRNFWDDNKNGIIEISGENEWNKIDADINITHKELTSLINEKGQEMQETAFEMWKRIYGHEGIKDGMDAYHIVNSGLDLVDPSIPPESVEDIEKEFESIMLAEINGILKSINYRKEEIYSLIDAEINKASFFSQPLLKVRWWCLRSEND